MIDQLIRSKRRMGPQSHKLPAGEVEEGLRGVLCVSKREVIMMSILGA